MRVLDVGRDVGCGVWGLDAGVLGWNAGVLGFGCGEVFGVWGVKCEVMGVGCEVCDMGYGLCSLWYGMRVWVRYGCGCRCGVWVLEYFVLNFLDSLKEHNFYQIN